MRFVALWLCAACLGMFFAQMAFGTGIFSLDNAVKWTQPWRIITAIFAHAGVAHLFSNMLALGFFGLFLESRIGSKKLFFLFLSSGIIVNFLISIFSIYERSLGASGAVYAILGCLAILRPWMIIYVYYIPMPMIIATSLWFLQDVFGMFYPSEVASLAHIFGLFMGVILGFYWRGKYGDKPKGKSEKNNEQEENEKIELNQKLDAWEEQYMKPRK